MKTKIICTLGPSSFNPSILKKLKAKSVDIFRINLSHTHKKDIINKLFGITKLAVEHLILLDIVNKPK